MNKFTSLYEAEKEVACAQFAQVDPDPAFVARCWAEVERLMQESTTRPTPNLGVSAAAYYVRQRILAGNAPEVPLPRGIQ